MTPGAFIAKWRANARHERAAAQEHFLDLCALLDEPTPNSDPTGAAYAFEKGATKASGGEGWADVWRRGRFAWEYKGKHRDLEAAHRQLLQYAGALENPPLLVTSDIERVAIRTNWTNSVSERHEIRLEEMADPGRLAVLKAVFADPERLRPGKTRAALTAEAAAEFAELAGRLRGRGNDPQTVAHFVNRLVFCLFADDVDLLPAGLFERMLDASRKAPARFEFYARKLFGAMAERGGEVDFTPVAWFDGGLFEDASALPLEADDIALLQRAAALDWAEIDPSILGTLFERGLDPDKRSQLGAHYTAREMIELLIDPVVRRPLLAEWVQVRAQMALALAAGTAARPGSRAKRATTDRAETLFRGFLDRLRAYRVLDPACGSGNFLYLALLALKDLEHQAMVEAEALGLQREFPQVGPEAVLGLEVNPYAAELARVSVWIGHIQWARRHGFSAPSDPVLRRLDTIECRDAVLADDGAPALWPTADVIVGNPPFLGGKRMRSVLGNTYCRQLFAAYTGQVPAEADLVCYWVAHAQQRIAAGRARHAGLVTTNSIRGGANRRVLEPIAQAGAISTAWSDEPWMLDGAAVRVSLICWEKERASAPVLDGVPVRTIHADLTAGGANLTTARRLRENAGVAFMGDTKGGAFDVPGELARRWLALPSNANVRPNADVLRPWANGMDVTRRPSDTWIIDFGWTMSEAEASYYAAPYAHVAEHVRPVRATNNREAYAQEWWRHVEPRPGMHKVLAGLARFIVTARVSKHRLFVWMQPPTLADSATIVIARDDDRTFGILHSRFHELWALRLGTWLGVGNDPRYTPSTTFETFPFPDGLTPDRPAASYAADPRAQAIAQAAQALVAARDRWLNPPELVERVPEVAPGFPDRLLPKDAAAEAVLRKRTLTALYNQRGTPEGAWLDALHRALDAAVAAAYGWPADLPDAEVLARLLALNLQRSSTAPA
ncbi:MAG: class I SAM-dependent DNA methyltransferase [Acidisphaera sp.]|nr:class I SAM-dependent DNA methyltransferase [Acidisphaera sp.]